MSTKPKSPQAPGASRVNAQARANRSYDDEYHLRAPKSLGFGDLGVHQWRDSVLDPLQTQAMARWRKALRSLRGALSGERSKKPL